MTLWLNSVGKKSANIARRGLGMAGRWWYRLRGRKFLDKQQTTVFLQPYQVRIHPENRLLLPGVVNSGVNGASIFPGEEAVTEPVHVWRYSSDDAHSRQLSYGVIVTNRTVLCTDSNTDDFYQNLLYRGKRETFQTKLLIAPWSHYLDGAVWGGYYDFVMLVAGKLCRIKNALPGADFRDALIAYPLFNTLYEREYLALLGIQPEQVVDSRKADITFDECVLADIGHWFYPNVADIMALRKQVLAQIPATTLPRNRIYVSRSGRRRIINEAELINLLKKYDFEIIQDTPRSVAEQIAIYRRASFIVGPHGASLTNLLWCEPDAQLLELFSATYTPGFFRYLAHLLNLRYSAYYSGTAPSGDWAKGLTDDIFVSIPEVERCLDQMLTNRAG